MPEYLSPGVYINEVASGTRPIEGVGTAMAAFVGFTRAIPLKNDEPDYSPKLITSWSQYVDTFGADENGHRNPHRDDAFLSHAVYGYFLNGGGRCYVAPVNADGASTKTGSTAKLGAQKAKLQLPGRSAKAIASLEITPKEGTIGEIEISISAPVGDDQPEGTFTFGAKKADISETYENVTLARRGGKNVVETVNQASRLITLTELQTSGSLVERTPSLGTYTLKTTTETATAMSVPVKSTHFVGGTNTRTGVEGLEVAEDATMICCPDLMSAYKSGAIDRAGVKEVQLKMIAHCEKMGDRFAILDPLPGLSPQEAKEWRQSGAGYDSKYAALYYPWISVSGPDGLIDLPPSGHIAGVYARSDNERGVHKAPANEVIRGALNPTTTVTKGEQDTLNPVGVNCIRSFTGRGVRVWGARTLSSDPQWRYINVRRLFNYVEESIEQGTQWVVFEPNDADLWARVRRDVGAFLTGVWRDGALFGATPAEAFFVKCDAENNPEDVRDRGQLVIDVGLAPVKPAEFVVFRFTQFAGGGA